MTNAMLIWQGICLERVMAPFSFPFESLLSILSSRYMYVSCTLVGRVTRALEGCTEDSGRVCGYLFHMGLLGMSVQEFGNHV